MQNKSSITALMSAFGRAYHAEHERFPVFSDTLARRLMTDEEYSAVAGYILGGIDFFAPERKGSFADNDEALRYLVNTFIAPTPLCRAAYCEAALCTAMRTGTEQYVCLGAGLDTFALREPEFAARYGVWEVDHPATQADKLERLHRAGLAVPPGVHFVGVDFSTDDLAEKLLAAGFDCCKKTFFSWLGVSYYLHRDEIERLLSSLAALCVSGSTLLFDYADSWLFFAEERRVQNMVAMAEAGGESMRSCFDYLSLDGMLADHGFLVYEILEPADIQRQIIAPRHADIKAFEHINYVQAVLRK